MRINELMFAIQKFFEAIFKLLTKLGNFPNVLFIIVGFVLLFIWLRQMIAYNKEAEQNGTLK
jgi:hypothetical protein